VWGYHLRRRSGRRDGAGAVRAADHRDHPLPVCRQFLSKKRTAQALAELFGAPVSEGTVATMTRRAADGLDDFRTQVKDRIAESEWLGSTRPAAGAGALHWVHCARTDKYT